MSVNTSVTGSVEPLSLRGAVKSFLRHRDKYVAVIRGIVTSWWTNKTPDAAHQSMISLFCATGCESNDLISRAFSFLHPPYRLTSTSGVLGLDTDAKKAEAITT